MDENDEAGFAADEPDELLSIDELTALALADHNDELDDDALPWHGQSSTEFALLPTWYMPRPLRRITRRWQRIVVVALVAVLLGIEVSGLCSVFGQLVIG